MLLGILIYLEYIINRVRGNFIVLIGLDLPLLRFYVCSIKQILCAFGIIVMLCEFLANALAQCIPGVLTEFTQKFTFHTEIIISFKTHHEIAPLYFHGIFHYTAMQISG